MRFAVLVLEIEGLAAFCDEGLAAVVIGFEVNPIGHHPDDHAISINAFAAEHAAQLDPAERREQIVETVRIGLAPSVGVGGRDRNAFAAAAGRRLVRIVEDEARAQLARARNPVSVPIRNRIALGSMKIFTPWSSITSSSGLGFLGIIHGVAHAGAAAIGDADPHAQIFALGARP